MVGYSLDYIYSMHSVAFCAGANGPDYVSNCEVEIILQGAEVFVYMARF